MNSDSLEDGWKTKYRKSTRLVDEKTDAVVGFNVNIDVIHYIEETDLDVSDADPRLVSRVEDYEDLRSSVRYCVDEGENHEVSLGFELDIEGDEHIGGQGGIMSKYLSQTRNGVVFYSPVLSPEIASILDDGIVFPVEEDGELRLRPVGDCSNTQTTKRNHIFEFKTDRSGRLILSGYAEGFDPYFPEPVEGHIDELGDCALLSAFHDVSERPKQKIEKAASQLRQIEIPVHTEYVHKDDETASLVIEKILPEVDSLGVDTTEMREILMSHGIEVYGDMSLEDSVEYAREVSDSLGIERLHLHTYQHQVIVADEEYPVPLERIRDSALYGCVSSLGVAEEGRIPDSEYIDGFSPDAADDSDNENDKEILSDSLDEMRRLGESMHVEGFEEDGTARVGDKKVAVVPTLIHPNPVRTVGMGDITSAGAFTSEIEYQLSSSPQ
ncbi:MAG: ADP-dependent glucokinase/phosphofructokinase [Halobacteria archaeon]|nr:ADP-dependent glucokinase/phosphofructokinase [Halobacteria archaeon]